MLEKVLLWEKDVFLWLNSMHNAWADRFLWLFSGVGGWFVYIVFLGGCFYYRKSIKEWLLLLLSVALVILVCDLFSSYITKPYFARFRPTHHPLFMDQVKTVFDKRGDLYGFVSGHTTNAVGFLLFTTLLFRYKPYTWLIVAWALVMAYSRIYLGMHFITDVLGGVFFGLLAGFAIYRLYLLAYFKINPSEKPNKEATHYTLHQKKMIARSVLIYLVILVVISLIWMLF